jgi:ABC-2 type transport system permease protein
MTVDSPAATTGAFRRAVVAEAVKLTSTRSLRWTYLAFVLVTPVLALFVGVTGSLQPDDTVLGGSLTGAPLAQLVAAAFGAVVVTGEYSTGTIRPTFAAMPRRGTVLVAKASVVAAAVVAAGLASAAAAHLVGTVLLSGDDYAAGDPFPALVGVAVSFAALAVLGVAVGALLRHSAGAVAAVVGVVLVPGLVAPVFGDVQRWIAGASPTAALEKMTQTSDAAPEVVGSLGAWPSLALVAAYTVASVAAAAAVLRTRDV